MLVVGFTNMTELPFALAFKDVAVRQTRSSMCVALCSSRV